MEYWIEVADHLDNRQPHHCAPPLLNTRVDHVGDEPPGRQDMSRFRGFNMGLHNGRRSAPSQVDESIQVAQRRAAQQGAKALNADDLVESARRLPPAVLAQEIR